MKKILLWSSAEQYLRQICEFITLIILSRILFPEDFGLFALTAFVIGISNTLSEGGFRNVIIKHDLQNDELNSIFWFNFSISSFFVVVIFLLSPIIETFYSRTSLSDILRVLSLNILITSYHLIPSTKLLKEGRFKELLFVSLPASIVSSLFAITAAYLGFGVWSLVVKSITQNIIQIGSLYNVSKWMPSLTIKFDDSFKKNLKDGSNFMFANVINTTYNESINNIIGKLYSVSALGYYSQSKKLSDYISQNVTALIGKVSLPLLAKKESIYENYLKLMYLVLLVTVPIVLYGSTHATEIVLLILGEKWRYSSVLFQILVFQGIFYPISKVTSNILIFKIASSKILILETMKKLFYLLILVILILIQSDIKTFVFCFVLISALDCLINLLPIVSDIRIFGKGLLIIFAKIVLLNVVPVGLTLTIESYYMLPLFISATLFFGCYIFVAVLQNFKTIKQIRNE